jgi:hypothetical protein
VTRRFGRRAPFLLALLLAGCARGPSLEQRLAPLIGKREVEVVMALGVPTRTYEADGRKFLQYEERRTTLYPGYPYYWGGPYGRFGPVLSPGPVLVTRACDMTFTLRQGVVEAFSLHGDDCR